MPESLTEQTTQTLELLSEREVLEALKPEQLVDLILESGNKVTQIEKVMSLAVDVLEGGYGITVEDVLQQRETNNGNQT